ncbi:hypothetical protein [Lichenibacterium ramalinae]|uniref:Uncharacterized protein n=1 Tax=Lichenibacterium ramalinae TaxID=2316527 RepID=A0A4Q2RK55_9HYPH|nr:hypothetical protein [Lichenibacterium ramalinae]RYB06969.1 hypothetical protein D3272_02460 [Lichenibacterium ramalinae]
MSLRALTVAVAFGTMAPTLAIAAPPAVATAPVAEPAAAAAAATTSDPAGAHAAIAQAQERLAEIDATITVMQDQADKADAAARQKARDAVAALKGIRDTYKKEVDEVAARGRQMTADQLAVARAALTAPWTQFEQALDQDVRGLKLDVAQRKAIVEARIKAEQTYWQDVIADLQATAANLTAEQRAAIDARVAAVRAHAEAAKARLTRLGRAGQTAWSALKQGLVNSRQVFDETYRGTR